MAGHMNHLMVTMQYHRFITLAKCIQRGFALLAIVVDRRNRAQRHITHFDAPVVSKRNTLSQASTIVALLAWEQVLLQTMPPA
ncbi:hypothetical protein D3C80_1760790 [compost metagenome]